MFSSPKTKSIGRRIVVALVAGAALAVLGAGCAGRHLSPRTGRAYEAVFKAQRYAKAGNMMVMSGEDAEMAVANMEKASKASEFKQQQSNFLLPLSR